MRRKLIGVFILGIVVGLFLYIPVSIWSLGMRPHEPVYYLNFAREDFNLILEEESSPSTINASDYYPSGWQSSDSGTGIFAMEVLDLRTYGSPFNMYFMSDNETVHELINVTYSLNYSIRIGPPPTWTELRLNNGDSVGDIFGRNLHLKVELAEAATVVHFTFVVWYTSVGIP